MLAEPFEVRTTRAADKDLRALRQWEGEIEEILLDLGDDPYRGELLAGSLRGVRSLHFSLKGSGEFRAAYIVLEAQRVCLVFMISPRENFYQEAARRYAALQRR